MNQRYNKGVVQWSNRLCTIDTSLMNKSAEMIPFPAHDSFVFCRSLAVKQPTLMATCAMNPWTCPKTSQTWRSWQSQRKKLRKWQNQNSWIPRRCQCCDDMGWLFHTYDLWYLVVFPIISKIKGMCDVAGMLQHYMNCRLIWELNTLERTVMPPDPSPYIIPSQGSWRLTRARARRLRWRREEISRGPVIICCGSCCGPWLQPVRKAKICGLLTCCMYINATTAEVYVYTWLYIWIHYFILYTIYAFRTQKQSTALVANSDTWGDPWAHPRRSLGVVLASNSIRWREASYFPSSSKWLEMSWWKWMPKDAKQCQKMLKVVYV